METRSIKRLRQRQGSDNNKTNLMDVDNDNLVDIFSKLPAKSLIQLGCMSKTLSNIVSCPYFVKQHMHFLTATNAASEVPRLMVVAQSKNRYAGELTVLQSLQYDGTSLEKSRHTIVSKVIFRRQNYSFDLEFLFCNLVCLKDSNYGYGRRCLLLNPLKGEAVILPVDNTIRANVPANPIPKSYEYWYGMGFDNANNKYKIVRVFGYKFDYDFGYTVYKYLVSHVHVLGTSSWREIDSVPPRKITDKKVSAYGDMHWLTTHSRRVQEDIFFYISILTFDFKKDKFCWNIPVPPSSRGPRNFPPVERFQLINLKGSLSLIDASSDKYLEIWMLNNYDEKEWIFSYRIDGSALIAACPYRSFRFWTCGEWEHGIFFKKSDCTTPDVIFLDLRSASINCVECPVSKRGLHTSVLSYTSGLISLRSYGNLVEPKTSSRDLNAFSNLWKFD